MKRARIKLPMPLPGMIALAAATYPAWAFSGWFIPTPHRDPFLVLILGMGLRLAVTSMVLVAVAILCQHLATIRATNRKEPQE